MEQKKTPVLEKKNSMLANKRTLVHPKRVMYCRGKHSLQFSVVLLFTLLLRYSNANYQSRIN